MFTNEYVKRVYAQVEQRDGDQPEFLQAVREVLETLEPVVARHPEYEANAVLERFVEPERVVKFRVVWMDDDWTVVTEDGSLSAHYENTILITEDGPEILSML